MARRAVVLVSIATAIAGCHSSADDAAPPAASAPCNPLAAQPTTLGARLSVGRAADGTLYVADVPAAGAQPRAFVSNGDGLQRWHIAGSGSDATDYTLEIEPPSGIPGAPLSLVFHIDAGAATASAMALGPDGARDFIGGPGQTPLTIVDASAVAGKAITDLPGDAAYVFDVAGGDVVVVTAPGDISGSSSYRLFYGPPGRLLERTITSFEQALSGYPDIKFLVDGATYETRITVVYSPDAGPLGEPGPGTLLEPGGTTRGLTLRASRDVGGMSFVCF